MNEYKRLRTEANKESFKKMLVEKLGKECANCGSNTDIDYHHIVPLALGGTNRISNIAPLCYSCHQKAHGSENIRKIFRSEKIGRPRNKLPDNYENILWDYMYGKIGRTECQEKLGLRGKSKLTDKDFFKNFLKENGIKTYKNRVDMLKTKKCSKINHSGEFISKIIFADGKEIVKYIE